MSLQEKYDAIKMNYSLLYSSIRNRFLRFGKKFYKNYHPLLSFWTSSSLLSRRKYFWLIVLMLIFLLLLIYNHSLDINSNYNQNLSSKKQSSNAKKDIILKKNYIKSFATNESKLGMIYSQSDLIKKQSGIRLYSFNSLVSERLGFLPRSLPDTRHKFCLKKHNNQIEEFNNEAQVPITTTVIICFYNEEFYTLIRTINTLLIRTSSKLLKEILLIDDYSDNDLQNQIKNYNKTLMDFSLKKLWEKVFYYRIPERTGLIRARNYGAQFAHGEILFFLDSHCEVNIGWLEPLIERLQQNPKSVVCPIIDLIDPDTFLYKPSPMVRGGFNWALHFKWDSIPSEELLEEEDFIQPIRTPAMAGGLFAINKSYFFHLGQYDSGMNIWGGENIEFSLRIWMCGGQLEIIPCSRIGHIFRKRRPYDSPDGQDTLAYNSLRVAYVWLDDYKKYFLSTRKDLPTMSYGNIDDRLELRSNLKCKSFDWYLNNIYPELLLSIKNNSTNNEEHNQKHGKLNLFQKYKTPKFINKFLIQLNGTNFCLESLSELSYKINSLNLNICSPITRRQIWKQTELNELRMGIKGCLESSATKSIVYVSKCHQLGSTQKWSYGSMNQTHLYNEATGTCLAAKKKSNSIDSSKNEIINSDDDVLKKGSKSIFKVFMSYCDLKPNNNNIWNLIPPK